MGPELIASHTQKTSEVTIYHQYLNFLSKSIIHDETGKSLEYRHIIKQNKYKETWVKYFPHALGCLTKRVGYGVYGNGTIFYLAHKNTNI